MVENGVVITWSSAKTTIAAPRWNGTHTHTKSKRSVPHNNLVFAATTRQFRRVYEFDEGRGETIAEEPIELDRIKAQDISERAEKESVAGNRRSQTNKD